MVEQKRYRHIAELMMMPVGLTVGRDMDQLRRVAGNKRRCQTISKTYPILQQITEGDTLRDRAVIKKQRDRSSRRKMACIGDLRIDTSAADIMPFAGTDTPNAVRLIRA